MRWLLLPLLLAFGPLLRAQDPSRDAVTLLEGYAVYKMGDYAQARAVWEPLAQRGNPTALLNIANLYEQGQGVDKDPAKAFAFTERAAQTGFANAQLQLGLLYEHGKGTPRDLGKAAEWFEKAAEQGLADAQYNLGVMYATRFGNSRPDSEENRASARKWLDKAAAQGYPGAKEMRALLN